MLIWMREGKGSKIVKYVLFTMLVMAVAGLVLMDVGGFFRSGLGDGTLVKGGGVNVSAVEFDRSLRRVLASQNMQPEEAYRLGVVDQVLQGEVQQRLLQKETQALGLHVGDDALGAQAAKLAEGLNAEGRTKKEALQQALRQQGISEGEFIQSLRAELANNVLRKALTPPATLSSPLMAESLYRYDNETRNIEYFVLSNDAVKGIKAPSEDSLKKYYEANKLAYLIPETRTVTMATLKASMLKDAGVLSDEELRAEYDKNIASFTKPKRRLVEQSVHQNEAAAKTAAETAKAGKSLKDSAPSDSYMGAQEFEENGLLPDIAGPVFSAKEGDVVGPIKTDLGWHVLVVQKILPESVTPFEQVKDKLTDELKQIAASNDMFEAGNAIEDRVAAGDKLEDIVREYGMTTEKIGPFRQNGMNAGGNDLFKSYASDKADLVQAAYDYDEGEITNIVETADGQFHILRIDQVVPDTYRPYDSVRSDLEKQWIEEQRRAANKSQAEQMLADLNSGKLSMAAASQGGAKRSTVNRKNAPEKPLTPIAVAQAFAAKKGEAFSAEIEIGYILGKVNDISLPSTVKTDEKEYKDLQDLVGRSLEQDILSQYISSLSKDKDIKINKAQLDRMYNRGAQQPPAQPQQ